MNLNNRPRPRFSPQQRAQLLKEFTGSPGSARDFAARHGIAASSLYRWQRRPHLLKTVPQHNGHAGADMFKQVAISNVLGSPWHGEVSLPDGTQLRWRDPVSVATLQELLGYLRRPC